LADGKALLQQLQKVISGAQADELCSLHTESVSAAIAGIRQGLPVAQDRHGIRHGAYSIDRGQ
jgi:hypothetical protein